MPERRRGNVKQYAKGDEIAASLAGLLKEQDAAAAFLPLCRYMTETFTDASVQETILSAISLLAPGGRILDAPENAPQPSVCALRPGLTGAAPALILVSACACSGGRTRITVQTAARAVPFPHCAKQVADRLLTHLLIKLGTRRSRT